jgi:hypothetical protein
MLDRMASDEKPLKAVYEKPELTVIEFSADEVMAVGCKSGPANNRKPGPGCQMGGCRQKGS